MWDWLVVAFPMVIAAAGYVLKRWIERRGRSERLKRRLQALALHKGLKREGLSIEDLDRLEDKAAKC